MGRGRLLTFAAIALTAIATVSACGELLEVEAGPPGQDGGGNDDGGSNESSTEGSAGDASLEAAPDAPPRTSCEGGVAYYLGVYSGSDGMLRVMTDGGGMGFSAPMGIDPKPIGGHWFGGATGDTLGIYDFAAPWGFMLFPADPATPAAARFKAGTAGQLPLAGDWDGDRRTTVGLYRPGTGNFGVFHTTHPLNDGGDTSDGDKTLVFDPDGWIADGGSGGVPIAGDWDCDGKDGIGVFRQTGAGAGIFHLKNSLEPGDGGAADLVLNVAFSATAGAVLPVAGDWDGDGLVTVGVYDVNNRRFYLSNTLADADLRNPPAQMIQFPVGDPEGRPVAFRGPP